LLSENNLIPHLKKKAVLYLSVDSHSRMLAFKHPLENTNLSETSLYTQKNSPENPDCFEV